MQVFLLFLFFFIIIKMYICEIYLFMKFKKMFYGRRKQEKIDCCIR
jgi:hypothetical protein